jgi:hypothetical protein
MPSGAFQSLVGGMITLGLYRRPRCSHGQHPHYAVADYVGPRELTRRVLSLRMQTRILDDQHPRVGSVDSANLT